VAAAANNAHVCQHMLLLLLLLLALLLLFVLRWLNSEGRAAGVWGLGMLRFSRWLLLLLWLPLLQL
jgi:hypothetical protein